MQIKQTFSRSYLNDNERQETIKKIYRQLHAKFQYGNENAKKKIEKKASLCE